MLDIALKNITRVRTRSFLTVLGIIIGIAAIVSLGSIADGLNAMVQQNMELTSGKIMISQKGGGNFIGGMSSTLTQEDLDAVASVSGVKEAVPIMIYFDLTQQTTGIMGIPGWWAIGIETDKMEFFRGDKLNLYSGREIDSGESGVALLGKDVADKLGLETGDTFTIKGADFDIVGVLEKSQIMDIDSSVIVPIKDLQDLLKEDTFHVIYAIPEDVAKAESVAADINDADENVEARTSTEIARQASTMINNIRFFTVGIAGIAAVVGGLGVMNTMIMTVMERRREIGVLKAIGATNRRILTQFLMESGLLSVLGGLVGIGLGTLGAVLISVFSGFFITPVVSPGLVLTAFSFALALGLLGGLWPAWRAAKLDPVEALRYE